MTPVAGSAARSRNCSSHSSTAHRIPRPLLNAWLTVDSHRYQADCLWPDAHLVGELDGFKYHGTKRAFGNDRKRDRRLGAAGFRVVRITSHQLLHEPSDLAADLHALLAGA
jgi:very-short-patch-repair endonuclease